MVHPCTTIPQRVKCQNQSSAFDLPLYLIFVPQKVPLKFMMTSLHVICSLGPPMATSTTGHDIVQAADV